MSACFWLWFIWLVILLNGLSGYAPWPTPGQPWGWGQYRLLVHLIFMAILAFLIYKVCGSLTGNLVH
jgi:hypothetical protein